MSALIGLLHDEYVLIGTDTLATSPYQEGDKYKKPLYYTSKVYHLPQFKSCFACTGAQIVGIKFYDYFTRFFIGRDINSIINIDLKHFRRTVEETEPSCHGTIYLYGYDDKIKKFKGFHLYIGPSEETLHWLPFKSISETVDEFPMAMSPQINDFWDLVNKILPASYPEHDFIKNGIIVLKEADDTSPVNQQVGIGGDIVLTVMQLNETGNFMIISQVLYEFPDKDFLGELMFEDIEC